MAEPTPADLGLSDKFSQWRKGQFRAFEGIVYTKQRFTELITPCGSGKSATYMASSMISDDERTAILTATRSLQDQLLDDFLVTGLVDIRGRDNYICNIDESKTAGNAKCTAGVFCSRMKRQSADGPCDYYDQKFDASRGQRVNTNYAFWLHDEESASLGQFHRLILDEAHKAPEEIERFAQVVLTSDELKQFGIEPPKTSHSQGQWKIYALDRVQATMHRRLPGKSDLVTGSHLTWLRKGKAIAKKLARLCRLSEHEWLFSHAGRAYRWDLLEPAALAEDLLFRGARKIVLASATVNKKTIQLLGVDPSLVKVIEQDSTFPVRNRPIYFWPVARVGMSMSSLDMQYLIRAIDQIIESRLPRKGIIHAVSYRFAQAIVEKSKFAGKGVFLLDDRKTPTAQVVAEFRRRKDGAVLVSPAVQEGLNFPGQEAEFQIIAKMPFPDRRDPLIQAKTKRDRDYIPYVVLQNVVQAAGRIVRSETDVGETWILDGHFTWLRGGYYHYLPRWFSVAIRTLGQRLRLEDMPALLRRAA